MEEKGKRHFKCSGSRVGGYTRVGKRGVEERHQNHKEVQMFFCLPEPPPANMLTSLNPSVSEIASIPRE